jgi:hypothetical protein
MVQSPNESTRSRVRFEVEIVGTDAQVLSALGRHIREQGGGAVNVDDALSLWGADTREDILSRIFAALRIEDQIRRVLDPLTVESAGDGPSPSQVRPTSAD